MRLQGFVVVLAATAVVALAGACKDQGTSQCLEPNALPYAFSIPGDTGEYFHWPSTSMPVTVYAEPVGNLPANTDSGIALWNGVLRCGHLTLTRVSDSTAADIIVHNPAFLPPPPPAPPAGSRQSFRLAADSVGACTGVTYPVADTSARPWKLIPPIRSYVAHQGADSLATEACYHFTVAHELGHALGLFGHSPNQGDLMYKYPSRRFATAEDRVTLQTLYLLTPTIKLGP